MDFEQMKQKYDSALKTAEREKVQLSHVHIQDNKLFIQGVAPSDQAKNKVWDQAKLADPGWAKDLVMDISVQEGAQAAPGNSTASPAKRTYTVQAGDTLSKISKDFYGNAGQYTKIFDANRGILSDPNKINPGQTLSIPE